MKQAARRRGRGGHNYNVQKTVGQAHGQERFRDTLATCRQMGPARAGTLVRREQVEPKGLFLC